MLSKFMPGATLKQRSAAGELVGEKSTIFKENRATRSSPNTHKLHRYAITFEGGTPGYPLNHSIIAS